MILFLLSGIRLLIEVVSILGNIIMNLRGLCNFKAWCQGKELLQ